MTAPIYVALDIETTGLSPERDAIIEIGMIKFDEERVLDQWATFVNPGRRIPIQITQLTGITPDMVRDAPTINKVLPQVRDFAGAHTLLGHNVAFDLAFLRAAGLYLSNRAIDTFALGNVILLHLPRHDLGSMAKEFGITRTAEHRALDDADTTRQLFLALCDRAADMPLQVLQEINKAARGSEWPLTNLFRSIEARRSRSAFMSSLGAQLQAKGFGAGGRLGFLVGEEELPELEPQPDLATTDAEALARLLEPGGRIAGRFPGYEHRPQQVTMLRAVADALREGRHLVVEAGTGTGKSLAYLIPAAHIAASAGKRAVISTNTINLQDQLYQKDIPDLQATLPFEFRAAVLKGRSNYICLRKLRGLQDAGALATNEMQALAQVMVWAQSTTSGDKAELFLPSGEDRSFWSRVSADSESCAGPACSYSNRDCFLQRARRRAEAAHLVIANHSLLLADAATENAVLPEYRYLIVDEAHHLEDATTKQLSFEATQAGVEAELSLLSGASPRGRAGGILAHISDAVAARLSPGDRRDLETLMLTIGGEAGEIADACRDFFTELGEFTREASAGDSDYGQRLRITEGTRVQPAWSQIEIDWDNLAAQLGEFRRKLERVRDQLTRLDETTEWAMTPELARDLGARIAFWNQLQEQMSGVITRSRANSVDWIEVNTERNARMVSVHTAPLHVGELIKKHLLDRCESVILTSATLRAGDDFAYLRGRLGIETARDLAVGSPFDYKSSTLVYYVNDVPEPTGQYHQRDLAHAVAEVALALRGRTMVLFTSYRQLRATVAAAGPRLAEAGISVLEQGNGPSRGQLLQQFREQNEKRKGAVLMGTRSFWEGVDVAGPALSCVIIARLPFSVPSEPIFAARSETFDDAFNEYSVPDAVLRFRQGFGRLIRAKSDRGAVVILDQRILTKKYGETFQRALPNCTVERGPSANVGEQVRRWVNGDEL